MNVCSDMASSSIDVSAVTNHCREICAKPIRQIVNLLCAGLGVRKQRLSQMFERALHGLPVANSAGIKGVQSIEFGCVVLDLLRESRHFVQQQATDYPGLRLPKHLRVLMLLCGDSRSLTGCAPGKDRDDHSHDTYGARSDRSPPGPERGALSLHRKALSKSQSHPVVLPFVLEPILP